MNTQALILFMKKIDTGGYSFARIREEDCYYVDKTLLIKDIFDNNIGGIYLFTRPRRFGKTLNLSMIDAYFNINYRGEHLVRRSCHIRTPRTGWIQELVPRHTHGPPQCQNRLQSDI